MRHGLRLLRNLESLTGSANDYQSYMQPVHEKKACSWQLGTAELHEATFSRQVPLIAVVSIRQRMNTALVINCIYILKISEMSIGRQVEVVIVSIGREDLVTPTDVACGRNGHHCEL